MKITYDNYNTTRINEALISNFFATIILDICATTQLLITIIITIIIIIYIYAYFIIILILILH
jgi:hypothetical protein